MSYDTEIRDWRDGYERRVAAKSNRPPVKRDPWGKVIPPDPPEPPFDPARPVYEVREAADGYVIKGPRVKLGGDHYGYLEGVIRCARSSYRHELGATLQIYDRAGQLTRTLSWDGDRCPYPPPMRSHSA